MKKTAPLRPFLALFASLALLAGCGGGGDGGGGGGFAPPAPTTSLGGSAQYEGICTLETQKKFVRAYMDEMYLWYDQIPDVDARRYSTIPDYFDALRVRTLDANGLPRDRFSTVLPSAAARDLRQPQSAALLASHTSLVPVVKTVSSPGGRKVGYIQFNDHGTGAQDDLITAFRQMQAASVQDLVLDLRFNSGGFLYAAQAAASMIVGPWAEGKVFERLQYNAKRAQETASSTMLFSSKLQFEESQYALGSQLPQLDLPRVFILASSRTCSASESIINGLRGIDVQVIQIGSSDLNDAGVPGTCGKPYGFREKHNCGWAYFPIEFMGTNAKGFGEYTAGFRHNCVVQDSTNASAGSSTDPLLNAALRHADTGSCPTGTTAPAQSSATPLVSNTVTDTAAPMRPSWAGRLLLPQQQLR